MLAVVVSILLPMTPAAAESDPIWTQNYRGLAGEQDYGALFGDLALNRQTGAVYVQVDTLGHSEILGYDAAGVPSTPRPTVGDQEPADTTFGRGLAVDSVAGRLFSLATRYRGGGTEVALTAYGTRPAALWTSRYGGPDVQFASGGLVTIDPRRQIVYVLASTYVDSAPGTVLLGYGYDGTLQWESAVPSAAQLRPVGLAVDPGRGRVFFTGTTTDTNRVSTYAFSADGHELWQVSPRGTAAAADLAVNERNGAVLVTATTGASGREQDARTVSYSTDGALQWSATYGGAGAQVAEASVLDPATGDLHVTGTVNSEGFGDAFTVAYSRDGVRRWATRVDGGGEGGDAAYDVAFDQRRGIVYASGSSSPKPGQQTSNEYWLLAFDRVDGQVLDNTVYDSQGRIYAAAKALVVHEPTGRVTLSGEFTADPNLSAPFTVRTVAYPPAR